ncbi:hypothetical protein GGTG_13936 [Gaeumannomyces tritici R3-111a-1]|uniref:Uncharacterized protein n=1 Tax=Gaeumannomyces tritici (strain R3-111a-1) TaxID=644352 RepID=J3PK87_GAET3|nr:hypothetical protein GGTG_13936 [Gaeumannomyces tritici R3-111a-1]EJT68484.1 hypothetical protein GGTG_13936 [Gaeumannomyces tritici R3-111a-1]
MDRLLTLGSRPGVFTYSPSRFVARGSTNPEIGGKSLPFWRCPAKSPGYCQCFIPATLGIGLAWAKEKKKNRLGARRGCRPVKFVAVLSSRKKKGASGRIGAGPAASSNVTFYARRVDYNGIVPSGLCSVSAHGSNRGGTAARSETRRREWKTGSSIMDASCNRNTRLPPSAFGAPALCPPPPFHSSQSSGPPQPVGVKAHKGGTGPRHGHVYISCGETNPLAGTAIFKRGRRDLSPPG